MTRPLLCLLWLALTASPVVAQPLDDGPMDAEAEKYLERGLKLYKSGEYREAAEVFEEGFDIQPHRNLLYAWAQAERLAGDCKKARGLYRRFIDSSPPETQLAAARLALETCAITGDGSDEGHGDGDGDGDLGDGDGDHGGDSGNDAGGGADDIGGDGGGRVTLVKQDDDLPWYRDGLGAGLTTVGVAGLGCGLGFYLAARRTESRATNVTYEEFLELKDRASMQRTVAFVSTLVGVASLGAGIWRLAVADGGAESDEASEGLSSRSFGAWGDGRSVGIGFSGRF